MKPLRLSVFLPRPTGFYRGLLPQMLRGFEQAGFEVSGTTVKVAGQGSAELSASGSVTVRGGIVRIN